MSCFNESQVGIVNYSEITKMVKKKNHTNLKLIH